MRGDGGGGVVFGIEGGVAVVIGERVTDAIVEVLRRCANDKV